MMTMQSTHCQVFSHDIQALVCNCLLSGPIGAAAVTHTIQCSSYNCTHLANATPRRAQQQQQHATNRRPAITPTIDITSTLTEEKHRVTINAFGV